MTTTRTIQIPKDIEVEGLLDAVLCNIDGSMCNWWKRISYDWESENRASQPIEVKYLDPETDDWATKTLVAQDIVDAFISCYGKRVWGQTVLYDEGYIGDCLVSDHILQLAVFGKETYA